MNLPPTVKAVGRALWDLPLAAVIGIGLAIPVLAASGALSAPSGPTGTDSGGPLIGVAASTSDQGSISAFVTVAGGPDSDGDGVPDSADNCPAWFNSTQSLPPWPVPAEDPDCDGWSTGLENIIGTLWNVHCAATLTAADEPLDAWPPDSNDDRFVNIIDVNAMRPPVFNLLLGKNTVPPNPSYSARFDLNADDFINILDVNTLRPPIFDLLVPCQP